MNTKSPLFSAAVAIIFLGSTLFVGTAKAETASHSKDIVVERPSNLPELAQGPGIAFQLYTESGDGSAYLYLEQHNGERLVVLDVTDPGHVKLVQSVHLAVPGPFDFAQPLGGSSILVRFRNNQGVAVLDLHHAKAPVLKTITGLQYSGHAESLGGSAYLMVNEQLLGEKAVARDYQVIDASTPEEPILLYTAKLVNGRIRRDETGTTFLLGSEGLTIIRRPRVEEAYQAKQSGIN